MNKALSTQDKLNKALFKAISKNNEKLVNDLIAQGADVNSTQKDLGYALCTCLYKALYEGYREIAEILIKAGADVNLPAYMFSDDKNMAAFTPMNALICKGDKLHSGIKMLIRYGLDVNMKITKDDFILLSGSNKNNSDLIECCKELIKAGININYIDALDETALFKAAINNNIPIVKLLLEHGAEKNLASCFIMDDDESIKQIYKSSNKLVDNEAYILCQAAFRHNTEIIEKMLKFGVDINITYTDYRGRVRTPLTSTYHESMRKWLLQHGADPKFGIEIEGTNPLCNAVISDNLEQIKTLLSLGANPNEKWNDHIKATALHTALSHSLALEKAKILLKAGADVNEKDALQRSVMHYLVSQKAHKNDGSLYASLQEILDTIDLLVKKEAPVNAKDNIGNTPLHLASANGYGSVVLGKLIEIGNDINDKNFYGETALTLAATNNQKASVEYLISKGAKLDLAASICFNKLSVILKELEEIDSVDINNSEFNTLLHYAVKRGFLNVVKKLIKKCIKINAFNRSHQTALDIAVTERHEEIAEYLQLKGGKPYANLSN